MPNRKLITTVPTFQPEVMGIVYPEPTLAQDTGQWNEVQWSKHLAEQHGGICEYLLPDKSRIDIFQANGEDRAIAWEVEWAEKWKEGIGQCIFYHASMDNDPSYNECHPGLWLLMRPGNELNYARCLLVVRELKREGINMYFRVQKVPSA